MSPYLSHQLLFKAIICFPPHNGVPPTVWKTMLYVTDRIHKMLAFLYLTQKAENTDTNCCIKLKEKTFPLAPPCP